MSLSEFEVVKRLGKYANIFVCQNKDEVLMKRVEAESINKNPLLKLSLKERSIKWLHVRFELIAWWLVTNYKFIFD